MLLEEYTYWNLRSNVGLKEIDFEVSILEPPEDTELANLDPKQWGVLVSKSGRRGLLLPDIESCRECHGSGLARRNAPGQLPSTCVMCHGFHVAASGE